MDDLTNRLNDALLGVPRDYRRDLADFVQERAARLPAITTSRLDELIAAGRVHLGIDEGNARERRWARRR